MSAARHLRRQSARARRANLDATLGAMLAAVRCTCDVEIRRVEHSPGYYRMQALHDADCPAITSGGHSTFALFGHAP